MTLRRLRTIAGAALAAAAFWAAFAGIDAAALRAAVGSADPLWLVAAALSVFLTLTCVVVRFRSLAAAWSEAPPFRLLWHVTIVGQVANLIIPFRIGDGIKVASGSRGLGVRPAVLAAIVAVERLLDASALVVAAVLLLVSGYAPGWTRDILIGAALTGVTVVLVGFAVAKWIAVRGLAPRSGPGPGRLAIFIARHVETIRGGLAVAGTRTTGAPLLLGSLAIAGASTLTNFLTMRAFGLDVPVPVALLLLILVQSGTAVTGAPGGVGVSQFIAVEMLALWGVPPATALACSLSLFVVVRLPKIAMLPFALSALSVPHRRPEVQVPL